MKSGNGEEDTLFQLMLSIKLVALMYEILSLELTRSPFTSPFSNQAFEIGDAIQEEPALEEPDDEPEGMQLPSDYEEDDMDQTQNEDVSLSAQKKSNGQRKIHLQSLLDPLQDPSPRN
ncbi:hypothetical protein Bca4012_065600 [Brassica carinata]